MIDVNAVEIQNQVAKIGQANDKLAISKTVTLFEAELHTLRDEEDADG
ncbi:hypothetical protein ACWOC1_04880 [Enterococcus quebecensis]|nr:hypothetical protein [Enterococcus quebecensis]OJG75416.1 hypothetical protein RV12_GL001219 [Enterococcus quebecensis]